MNALFAAATALLVMFGGQRAEGTLDELAARYEAECTSKHPGADCNAIRSELEFSLYNDLSVLYRMGEEVDRETLRTAATANFPYLALLGLRWMAGQPEEGDDAAVIAALENPSAGVRSAALQLLGERLPYRVRALRQWILTNPNSQDEDLVPDADPDADLLGFSPYPGSRLVRFASGKTRAFYTTADPPEKVIGTISKGKTVLDSDKFFERVDTENETPDYTSLQAEMVKLMSETDPEKLAAGQAALERMMAPQSEGLNVASGFAPFMARSDTRFVILREQASSTPGDLPRITRAAAVFNDKELGVTMIFVPLQ